MKIKVGDKPIGMAYPLDRVKQFLRVTGTDQDAVITRMINAAVDIIEHETWVVLGSRTYTGYLDKFPATCIIPRYPITAISSVKYYDSANSLQTLSTGNYYYDIQGEVPRIYFTSEPTVYDDRYNAVEIAFTAGYADWHDIPDKYVAMLEMIVHQMYDGRQGLDSPMNAAIERYLSNNSLRVFT